MSSPWQLWARQAGQSSPLGTIESFRKETVLSLLVLAVEEAGSNCCLKCSSKMQEPVLLSPFTLLRTCLQSTAYSAMTCQVDKVVHAH